MKIEMLNDYGGLKKGRIYEIKDKTGEWLIANNNAIKPIKFFQKGSEETKQEVPVKKTRKPRKKKA